MSSISARQIAQIVIDALERTAFVLAEPAELGDAAELASPAHFSRVRYTGPQSGWVHLAASRGFIIELASSLLGVEPDDVQPDREGHDAIKELANIVGGSVILELGGDECQLSIGLPELQSKDDWSGVHTRGETCVLDAEGEALYVTWIADPAAQAAA